jgi:hypothetical protein
VSEQMVKKKGYPKAQKAKKKGMPKKKKKY